MKQFLWPLFALSSVVACADDEAGAASPVATASAGVDPTASPLASSGTPEAPTGSAPSSLIPGTTGSMAPAGPSGSPADPEPNASNDPDAAATSPRPTQPSAPRPEPSFPASVSSDGAGGDAGSVPNTNESGGAPSAAGAGGTAGAAAAPEPLAGCEGGPLDAPLDGCAPEFEETGDFHADCVARINQLRWECQCLPPLERSVELEDCANRHAQYDYEQDEAHAGISDSICESGGASQNECPDYNPTFDVINFCLQQMWDEGPGEDFQRHGHYVNMSSTTVTKVACGLYITPEGDFWSVQNFTR